MSSKIQDKKANLHVLGGLINNPSFLGNTNGYRLCVDDFVDSMHKIVYSTLNNLYLKKMDTISPNDIYSYLLNHPKQLAVFEKNNGIKYLESCAAIGNENNFDYYYNRMKKFSYLRDCSNQGIDVSNYYNSDHLEAIEIEEMEKAFDDLTIDDMIKDMELNFIEIKSKYLANSESGSEHISDDIDEILELEDENGNYGISFQSKFMNTATGGNKTSHFYLRSAPTGEGKTIYNLADLLETTVPEKWDIDNEKWIRTGNVNEGLFITTELSNDKIKKASLYYIAGVERKKSISQCTPNEVKRINRAKKILKETKMRVERLADFDLELVEMTIEKAVLKHNIRYVVFDYIHRSASLTGKDGLREDLALLFLADKLKEIADKYDISIMSSTQMNDNYKMDGNKNLDQSSLRGSKAIADKVDVGSILKKLSKEDKDLFNKELLPQLEKLEEYRGFGKKVPIPTHTQNIYKNRDTEWVHIRLWLNIDMGTLRTKDVCVTDYDGELITNFPKTEIHIEEDAAEEVVEELNENKELKLEINSEDIEKSLFKS